MSNPSLPLQDTLHQCGNQIRTVDRLSHLLVGVDDSRGPVVYVCFCILSCIPVYCFSDFLVFSSWAYFDLLTLLTVSGRMALLCKHAFSTDLHVSIVDSNDMLRSFRSASWISRSWTPMTILSRVSAVIAEIAGLNEYCYCY